MSEISDILNEFGGSVSDSSEKELILFRWMQAVTNEIDDHASLIRKVVELQDKLIALAEKDATNTDTLIELLKRR